MFAPFSSMCADGQTPFVLLSLDGGDIKRDDKDVLPRQKCLDALAALRHAKWFQVHSPKTYFLYKLYAHRHGPRRTLYLSTLSQRNGHLTLFIIWFQKTAEAGVRTFLSHMFIHFNFFPLQCFIFLLI